MLIDAKNCISSVWLIVMKRFIAVFVGILYKVHINHYEFCLWAANIFSLNGKLCGGVAQLGERCVRNAEVK
ncbi:MAG: hypothetical protein RR933_03895, partial [Oscillospiraceae bacterium]